MAVVVTVQQRAAVSLSESHEAIGHRRLGTGSTSSGRYVQDYNGPERIAIRPHSLLPPISPSESPSRHVAVKINLKDTILNSERASRTERWSI